MHFTPTIHAERGPGLIIGPSMCLALDREGYGLTDVNLRDLLAIATDMHLWKFLLRNMSMSLKQFHSNWSKAAFVAQARKLVPTLTEDMVEESFTGVMVQVFDQAGGAHPEFIFERNCLGGTTLHVRSTPSPACTSSMAIAEHVVEAAASDFGWAAASLPH